MSKTKLLKQVIDDLRQLASSLEELSDALSQSEPKEKVVSNDTPVVTLEDVRAVLAEKSRLGFTKEIKQIITDLGASKLSDVKESDYVSLLKKAEVLGNE